MFGKTTKLLVVVAAVVLIAFGATYGQMAAPELESVCKIQEEVYWEVEEMLAECQADGTQDCSELEILRNNLECDVAACWDLVDGVCSLY